MTNPHLENRRDPANSYQRWHGKWRADGTWGMVVAAIVALLIVGGIMVYVAINPRTVMLPADPTTGQGIPGPVTPAPPTTSDPARI
jgi:hypothetical protein